MSEADGGDIHIAKIEGRFESTVTFGDGTSLDCHVAVLEYVSGDTLTKYLNNDDNITAMTCAQVCLDLLDLWAALKTKGIHHNDLHGGNIIVKKLSDANRRHEALDRNIFLVAIDINSADPVNFGGDGKKPDDQQNIGLHFRTIFNRLLEVSKKNDSNVADVRRDKLVRYLDEDSSILNASEADCDVNPRDIKTKIEYGLSAGLSRPQWETELRLDNISDSINAINVKPVHVYELIPEGEADPNYDTLSNKLPVLITGMRGCGKTMLLYTLDFHARAVHVGGKKVFDDHYVGITVSCSNLVGCGETEGEWINMLFWRYLQRIIDVARHIQHIDTRLLPMPKHCIGRIGDAIRYVFDIDVLPELSSFDEIEMYMTGELECFYKPGDKNKTNRTYGSKITTVDMFEELARIVRGLTPCFTDSMVYFLLDDASFRHCKNDKIISGLLNTFLRPNNLFSFKISSESQSVVNLDVNLTVGRDYNLIDLGNIVEIERNTDYWHMTNHAKRILERRLKLIEPNSHVTVEKVMGKKRTHASIARHIRANVGRYSNVKSTNRHVQETYFGFDALCELCLGNIGDIIYIFKKLYGKYNKSHQRTAVSPKDQQDCFMDACEGRKTNQSNRSPSRHLDEYAKTFAQASNLFVCYEDKDGQPMQIGTLIIPSIKHCAGKKEYDKIFELIDSSMFVVRRGKSESDVKGENDRLIFRKIFGINFYAPLGKSHSLTLTDDVLKEWLASPKLEHLCPGHKKYLGGKNTVIKQIQSRLEDSDVDSPDKGRHIEEKPAALIPIKATGSRGLAINISPMAESRKRFRYLVVADGFEDRCIESLKRVLVAHDFDEVIFIKYDEIQPKDNSLETEVRQKFSKDKIHIEQYPTGTDGYLETIKSINTLIRREEFLIDISGMTQPLIFGIIESSVREKIQFRVAYTPAAKYRPDRESGSNACDEPARNSGGAVGKYITREANMPVGEEKEYELDQIRHPMGFGTRPQVLIGYLSYKAERLMKVMDVAGPFSRVELMLPDEGKHKTEGTELSRVAATAIQDDYRDTGENHIDVDDPQSAVDAMVKLYEKYTLDMEADLQVSLTGGKIQTLACAAFYATCKTSTVWYARTKKHNLDNSTGAKETVYFSVTWP